MKTRTIIRRRFEELATKEALGTITEDELAKLERYDALRHPKRTREEVSHDFRLHWEVESACKAMRKLIHQFS